MTRPPQEMKEAEALAQKLTGEHLMPKDGSPLVWMSDYDCVPFYKKALALINEFISTIPTPDNQRELPLLPEGWAFEQLKEYPDGDWACHLIRRTTEKNYVASSEFDGRYKSPRAAVLAAISKIKGG